jgi:hypothetical protein
MLAWHPNTQVSIRLTRIVEQENIDSLAFAFIFERIQNMRKTQNSLVHATNL